MTIPSLEVELASCFEAGQAYVALSRAVSLQQTRIITFNEHKVQANRKVVEFYAQIEAEQAAEQVASTPGAYSSSGSSGPAVTNGHSMGRGLAARVASVHAPAPSPPPPRAVAPSAVTASLSDEQKARIQQNKMAALAKRQMQQQQQQQGTFMPTSFRMSA